MNRHDLRNMDLHLLILFESLMLDYHVTKTAVRLDLSQPAVSAGLNRLRTYFDDPLLIRVGQTMEPTSKALDVLSYLAPALDSLSVALAKTERFRPAESSKIYRVGMSEDVELAFMATLVHSVRKVAPGIRIDICLVNDSTAVKQFSEGNISVAMGALRSLPAGYAQEPMCSMRAFVLRAKSDGLPLNRSEIHERPHVLVTPLVETKWDVDLYLRREGIVRNIALSVPRFSSLPLVLHDNPDFLAILPEHAARALTGDARLLYEPVPYYVAPMELCIVWPLILDADPAEKWLRGKIKSLYKSKSVLPGKEAGEEWSIEK